jgi:alpha-mannosidase
VHRHPQYTRERIRQVAARVSDLVHAQTAPPARLALAGPVGRIPFEQALALPYEPVSPGRELGPLWATYWLDAGFEVPPAWAGERVDLLLVTGSEATLWENGRALQGLHSGRGGWRPDAMLRREAEPGERIDVRVEIACNGLFGDDTVFVAARGQPPPAPPAFRLERCELARFDAEAWELSCDLEVLVALLDEHARGLDESWAGALLHGLNAFCNRWDELDRSTWPAARELLLGLLAQRNATHSHEVSAVGHAHIDTAWLWPLAETVRKCVRSFASQLALMERYPEHRFACSQAQQYAWVEEREPELWARIRERVEAGRWLPVGGSWVEPDCNLPSGESLVRQLLHGQRYFEQRFGRRSRVFWTPDVFGYNGQLPQLLRGAGMEFFLTQKLSWNRFTTPPYQTFTWQGIDGSEVLAHFPPADTYNAEASVEELRRAARAYRDHDRSRHSLLLFGYGDGGGGPTARMLERLRRVRDLQGVPRTTIRDPEAFFELLAADVRNPEIVVGELYFEYHRGTYTSQARVKRLNRRCERLLHDAELLAAAADRLGLEPYPGADLERLWRRLLTAQFHDILPGSSIREVYEEAEADLRGVAADAERLRDAALAALGPGGELRPVNTIGAPRLEVVELPDGSLAVADAPPCGPGRLVEAGDAVTATETGDGVVLANAVLRAELGRDGTVRSLVHLPTGREVLAAPGNVLELYEDRPTAFEAWDVDPFHLETRATCPPADAWEVVQAGPLRAEVAFERRLGAASRMRQVVRLDAHARRLELRCEVDWQERRRLLKVLFPVAVRSPRATYEMQFGVAERPTHYSTPADLARFEVPGHRFCDLSEHGFGVALLSASTYGWSAYGHEVRLSLLRAPCWPDPEADRGRHELAYAVVPHAGTWQDAGVTVEALAFNAPLLLARGAEPGSFAVCDDPNLLLDTVKRAEDSDALVLRLYEAHGARGTARVRSGMPFSTAARCTLLEDDLEEVAVGAGALEVPYRPFEVVTLKLRR